MNNSGTPLETDSSGADATLTYGSPSNILKASGELGNFRGWKILRQLPAAGAEADIFVIERGGARRALKLYRYNVKPKPEVLRTIADASRANPRRLVAFHESGYDGGAGRWFETLEYMPIGSLADIPLATKRGHGFISGLVPQLSEAIFCLHENGIIHCDIKPSNILIRSIEPLDTALTDFGIASVIDSGAERKMTVLKGTPMYWAPEAFSQEVGRPCDWWGLGMILLELLACEHPFGGMRPPEIIRALTVGNVAVPGFIGDEWGMLIKGLLTKDDSRRWGHDEVTRWLAGERDIPLFHEAPANIVEPRGEMPPFSFEGADYRSPGELARAMAGSESPWLDPAQTAGYVKAWLESAGDGEAARILSEAGGAGEDPAAALFRFIHRAADMPFSLMGHAADAESLCRIVQRASRGGASKMEIRIADMLSAGNLSAFYEEYMAIRGGDQNFGRVLRFLSSKPREIQTEALRAVVNPGEYAWPDGTGEGIYGAAEFFERAGRPPLRRDYLNSLLAEYLLPSSILDRLKSPAAYQPAADRLEAWSAKGLLLPTSADWKYKNADADSYERAARSICLGHTAHSSADLEDAIRELAEFQNERPGLSIPRITDRLINLRNGKLSPRDRNFIGELTKTIREARAASHKLKKNLPARVAASGAAGAVIYASWLAAGLPGGAAMFSAGLALMWAEFASVALARLNNPFAGSSGEWSGEGHGAMNRPKKFSAAAERLWDGTGRGEFRLAAMTGLCAAAGSALLIFLPLAGGALNLDGLASPAAGLIFPAAMAALPFAASFVIRAYKTSMLKFDVAKLCREYSGGMGDGD